MEMVAQAPASFTLAPRNPERAVTIGGGSLVLAPVGGSPFCSDLERGRREGTTPTTSSWSSWRTRPTC